MSHWRGAVVVSVSVFTVDVLSIEEAEGVRSAVDWAEVRAMHADGVTKREIARRLGISRNTVERLLSASEPPRYSRAPAGSMLDPLEGVLRRLVEEWPEIKAPRVTEMLRDDYGYVGSVDLVLKADGCSAAA